MTIRFRHTLSTAALLAALAVPGVTLAEPGDDASLEQEIAALRAEVAVLRRNQQEQRRDTMTEQQIDQVRGLIHEVLQDAETRASLLEDGLYAGWDDGFFLANPDDTFRMEIGGQIQFRYLHNFQDERDDEDDGFQLRRTKLGFEGQIGEERRFGYELVFAVDREGGSVEAEDVVISYRINDHFELAAGKFKLPFLREELLSSSRQLAVDRASVTEYFTLDRSEQIALRYKNEMIRAAGSINDGADEEFSTFGEDPVELSLTGRVDAKLAGEWDQSRDMVAWGEEPLGVFVGGALHYQLGDGSNADFSSESEANYLAWTLDTQVEWQRLTLNGAVMGGHIRWDDVPESGDRDLYGLLVQGGYLVTDDLQPFVRWEWMDDADDGGDPVQMITAGLNYFLNGHNAKLTTDLVWVFDGDTPRANPFGNSPFSDGLGLSGFGGDANDDPLIALRAQFQLLF